VEIREPKNRFLIVCEGEKTEPNYFRRFRVPREVVEIRIHGTGYNTMSLVTEALQLREKLGYTGEDDQVWCVFDRDNFRKQQFNDAIQMAQSSRLKVAYSNEAFELWYLLHFDYCDTALHRKQYIVKLSERMGRPYQKNDDEMYDRLIHTQETAILHARRLHGEQTDRAPADANPSTTVYLLVEELRKHMSD